MIRRCIPSLALVVCTNLSAQSPTQSKGPWDRNIAADMEAGYALIKEGKANEAAEKFKSAMSTDPLASWPYSGMADLYLLASQHTSKEHVDEYRAEAERWAFEALERNDLDINASRALKTLKGGRQESQHQGSPEAQRFFDQAENVFREDKFKEAVPLYQKALDLDPSFTDAALYLGDSHFRAGDYEKAEPFLRKATELEPGYSRAWRFLGDCCARMGRMKDAERASLGAISAEPDDYTAWARLRQMREALSKPKLARFKFPKVQEGSLKPGKNPGDFTFEWVAPEGKRPEDAAAGTFQLIHGMLASLAISTDPKNKEVPKSPFQVERSAWEAALETLDNASKEQKKEPKDAAWIQLRAMSRAGQLDAALFLLRFREIYRPDFEAWKKAHPGEVDTFIEKFQLRP